jgi:hypothetical protein
MLWLLLVERGCRRTRSTVYWIRARKPKLGCERKSPRMLERAREEIAEAARPGRKGSTA